MLSVLKHLFKLQFLVIFISIIVGIYYPELLKHFTNYFNQYVSIGNLSFLKEAKFEQKSNTQILFTRNTLLKYNGEDPTKDIYLGILGSVYDVTKGKKHYGSGCSYNMFAGRDASASFISGDFENYDENSDDVLSLSLSDLLSLVTWKSFYEKEYIYKGKLIGRFYDKNGEKTKYHHKMLEMVKIAEKEKADREKLKEYYPPCNIEWSVEKGTRVWCTSTSGGLERGWIGVPRQYFEPGQTSYRCACIKREDLNLPKFKQYNHCDPKSFECFYNID